MLTLNRSDLSTTTTQYEEYKRIYVMNYHHWPHFLLPQNQDHNFTNICTAIVSTSQYLQDYDYQVKTVHCCMISWANSWSYLTVVPPTANAKKSVNDVMVMAAPALLMVSPNLSGKGLNCSSGSRLLKHCMETNMSSMPMPRMRKGIMLWRGP